MGTCVQPLLKQTDARLKKNARWRCASKIESAAHLKPCSRLSSPTLNTQAHLRHKENKLRLNDPVFFKHSAHFMNITRIKCKIFPLQKKDYSDSQSNNILYYSTYRHLTALVFSGLGTTQTTEKPRLALSDSIAVRSIRGKNCLPDPAYLLTFFERVPFKAGKFGRYLLRTWQKHSYPVQQLHSFTTATGARHVTTWR